MRYAPYSKELIDLEEMSDNLILEYFLTRVFETEEVWGLDDGCEWVVTMQGDQQIMPIWPYQQLAAENVQQFHDSYSPTAESLEDFVFETLGELMEDDILLAIMPTEKQRKCLITPHRLHDIFTGMMDAGEYKMDG